VSNEVLAPEGMPEDAGLDQAYDPLPDLPAAQSEEEAEEVITSQLRRRGRLKGSKNKSKAAVDPTKSSLWLLISQKLNLRQLSL
jgi:hypothetical protein